MRSSNKATTSGWACVVCTYSCHHVSHHQQGPNTGMAAPAGGNGNNSLAGRWQQAGTCTKATPHPAVTNLKMQLQACLQQVQQQQHSRHVSGICKKALPGHRQAKAAHGGGRGGEEMRRWRETGERVANKGNTTPLPACRQARRVIHHWRRHETERETGEREREDHCPERQNGRREENAKCKGRQSKCKGTRQAKVGSMYV